jgi:hypothetical protein
MTLMALDLLVSTVAVALGAFVVIAPQRAAEIWGSTKLQKLAPEQRPSFIRWYRTFGLLLLLVGTLFAVDRLLFSR